MLKQNTFQTTRLTMFDSEQLRSASKDSNIENFQLYNGVFRADLMRIELPKLVIDYGLYNIGTLAQGEFTKESHVIGIILNHGSETKLYKSTVQAGDICFFPAGSEIDLALGVRPHWCTLAFEKESFEETMNLILGTDNPCSPDQKVVIPACLEGDRLLSALRAIFFDKNLLLLGEERPENNLNLVEFLMTESINLIFGQTHSPRQNKLLSRKKVVLNAEEYMNTLGLDEIKVANLAHELNISIRTLEYAFNDIYGITPKRFLNIRRLNIARQMILRDPQLTVTEHAINCGYWHMSQFAADYKALFGESPSGTLKTRRLML